MTDLNALIVFAKVVEAKSFSEAARRLGMPVSTVSRRIAELEDQLGIRLLDRSTRSLRLTELGSEILEQAMRSVEVNEAVESIISNKLSNVSGTLRLSAPPSISDTLLTPLVTAFQASYPNVRVQILDNRSLRRSHSRRRRHRVQARRPQRFITGRAKNIELSASTCGEPGLSEELPTARKSPGFAAPPAACILVFEARRELDLCSCQRKGPRNSDIPAAAIDE